MTPAPSKVLIRCDAAPEIGFGHVVRCLALADELRDGHGCLVEFAMMQGPQGFSQVQAQGYSVYTPADRGDDLDEGCWLRGLAASQQVQILILDVRTKLAKAAVQSIRESGALIVTIDDPSDRRLAADLAFYPPVPQLEGLDWTGFSGERFVGWDWVLLRPQFAEAARKVEQNMSKTPAQTLADTPPLTLIITMGGSDPAGLTLMALEALEQIDADLRVLVVIGVGFIHESALSERLGTTRRHYEIIRNVTDMASLMIEADLAVASFGVTAYELAVMRIPTVYLCHTEDHARSASVFGSARLGVSLGRSSCVALNKLTETIKEMSLLIYKNKNFYESVISRPDGLGVLRIANCISGTFCDRGIVD